MSNKRKKLVPQCGKALEAMKYEFAAEIGLIGGQNHDFSSEFSDEFGGHTQSKGYNIDWGNVTSRHNGYIGGHITQRLVQQAQQTMANYK